MAYISYDRKAGRPVMFLVAIAVYLALIVAVYFAGVISSAPNSDTTVYTTRTGECYHEESCSTVGRGYETTLAEAVRRGYRPCGRCGPPILKTGEKAETAPLDLWSFLSSIPGLLIWGYYIYWGAGGIFAMLSVELRFLEFRWYVLFSALTILVLYAIA